MWSDFTATPGEVHEAVWNIGRYLGVRESFVTEWQPKGGIEISLIDMMAQCYFQWQYWLEETVKRSQTKEALSEQRSYGGYWPRPFVSEQQALDKAVEMADRFHRMFMRTLRQLRDLRRYSPVTINNAGQVNIASEGGKQVNLVDAVKSDS